MDTDTSRTGARIQCEGLVRIYASSETEVVALQGLDLDIAPGEIVSVMGASGSGKSTMLNILAGLDRPTAGQVRVDDHDLLAMNDSDRLDYRRRVVGFVWQQTGQNLLPYLTALENVVLPLAVAGVARRPRTIRAQRLLELVGLESRTTHRPAELSGGEQQRVAIAVALANTPRLILADEPTGELDADTAGDVIDVLKTAATEEGATTVMVTHDEAVAATAHRVVTIRDGRVSSERRATHWAYDRVEEQIVLDRAGRLQLPDEHVRSLRLGRLVRVEAADDHLRIERGSE